MGVVKVEQAGSVFVLNLIIRKQETCSTIEAFFKKVIGTVIFSKHKLEKLNRLYFIKKTKTNLHSTVLVFTMYRILHKV